MSRFRTFLETNLLAAHEKILVWCAAVVCFGYGIVMIAHYLDKDYYRTHLADMLLCLGVVFVVISIGLVCLMRIALLLLCLIAVFVVIISFSIQIFMVETLNWFLVSAGVVGLIYSVVLVNIFLRSKRRSGNFGASG